jgi:hypothetical protein
MGPLIRNADEVLTLLNEGWELGCSVGRTWMQKGGLCRGGESRNVHGTTVNSMIKKRLIVDSRKRKDDPFWLSRYQKGPNAPQAASSKNSPQCG